MRLTNKFRPAILVDKNEPTIQIEDEVKKQQNFQRDKYVSFLKRFIDAKCEYDYQHMTFHDDIKKAYAQFLTDNKDEICKYNVNYSLTVSDIGKLDPRFEFKAVTVCKFCKKKQFKDCCLEYMSRIDRTKHIYMINLKLVGMS
jgi:hypothetical protein